ncbi:MAG: PilZ domain-containing protein [Desulfobulbaceae bacterium]|nr:PilZ domain-containing protein [Desulfobulbaceae bacterium]
MGNPEKRKNARVSFQATVTVRFDDQTYDRCETRDLSLKGLFVVGVAGRPLGEKCRLSLYLSGTSSDLSLEMSGTVVRLEADGVGIHFTEIDLDSFFHLKNIVYFNIGDPDQLEKELSAIDFEPSGD